MITEFIKSWDERKSNLEGLLKTTHPESYEDLLKMLISEVLNPDQEDNLPSISDIETKVYGDYSGTLLFIVPDGEYDPEKFWITKVFYGSCSFCDTFQSIRDYTSGDNTPSEAQVSGYMTLALHLLQKMKEI